MTVLQLAAYKDAARLSAQLRRYEFVTSGDIVKADYSPTVTLSGTLLGSSSFVYGRYIYDKLRGDVVFRCRVDVTITAGVSPGDICGVTLPIQPSDYYDDCGVLRIGFAGSFETGNVRVNPTTGSVTLARDSAAGIPADTYQCVFSLTYEAKQ